MTETLNIRVKYRPLRIGMCIDDQDFDALRKAIKLSNALYGGCFNPIIPINNEELAKQLISTFRVDFLYPVSNTDQTNEFIKKFNHLPYPFFGLDLFPIFKDNQRESIVLDVHHAIRFTYEKFFKNISEPRVKSQIYKWSENDPLKDVFLITFGGYPEKESTPVDYQKMLEKNFSAQVIQISADHEHPSDFFDKITPRSLSEFALKSRYSIPGYLTYHEFYIGNCESFEDLVSYWNLKAAGLDIVFYDPSKSERFNKLKSTHAAKINSVPEYTTEGKGRLNLRLRTTTDIPNYSEFGDRLLHCTVDETTWNGLNIKPPYIYFLEKSTLTTIHKDEGKTSIAFQLPDKPFCNEPFLNRQHIVISVDLGIGLFNNDNETLDIPYLPELNKYYGLNCYYNPRMFRAEPQGIGIINNTSCNSLKLYALKVDDIIAQIFNIHNIKAASSQPGTICKHLIHQMGGIRSCKIFKIAGLRKLINNYSATKSFTRSDAQRSIREEDNGVAGFSKYEDLFIEQRDFNTKLKPENVLTYLLKKKAFSVGLEFKCPSCKLDFWISLDNAKTDINCEYCGNSFNSSLQIKDRDWRYRRSGLLGKDNHQEGAIPVIMMLEQFIRLFPFNEKYLYTTATTLASKKHKINCEIDFVILRAQNRNGKLQIAIGECKDGMEISDKDVQNIKAVTELLKSRFDVYTIFVKLTGFTKEELKKLETLNEDHTKLILLNATDLETENIFNEVEDPSINKHDLSFKNIANVTKQRYYP